MELYFRVLTVSALSILISWTGPNATLASDRLTLTDQEIQEDRAWLERLGVEVPAGGYLLKRPWDLPLSSRSFMTPISWFHTPPPEKVSPQDLLQDMPYIRIAFEKAYSGYEVARSKGWNWEKWFRDWEALLRRLGSDPVEARIAFEPYSSLKRLQPDNHTGPGIASSQKVPNARSQSALLAKEPKGECTRLRNTKGIEFQLDPKIGSHRPVRAWYSENGDFSLRSLRYYIPYPSQIGVAQEIYCENEWIALSPFWSNALVASENQALRLGKVLALAQIPKDQATLRWIEDGILYLRIPSTGYEYRDSFIEVQNKLKTIDIASVKVFILDNRLNRGGYDFATPSYDLITYGQYRALEKSYPMKTKQSCLSGHAGAGLWGQIQGFSKNASQLPAEDAKVYSQVLKNILANDGPNCPITWTGPEFEVSHEQHRFQIDGQKQVYLFLVDDCGSTCEGAVYNFGRLPNTLLAGKSTTGVGQFTGGNGFVFPNTKIQFAFASGVSNPYGDYRPYDGYGLHVDMILHSEKMHEPEYILQLARSLKRKIESSSRK